MSKTLLGIGAVLGIFAVGACGATKELIVQKEQQTDLRYSYVLPKNPTDTDMIRTLAAYVGNNGEKVYRIARYTDSDKKITEEELKCTNEDGTKGETMWYRSVKFEADGFSFEIRYNDVPTGKDKTIFSCPGPDGVIGGNDLLEINVSKVGYPPILANDTKLDGLKHDGVIEGILIGVSPVNYQIDHQMYIGFVKASLRHLGILPDK